MILRKLAAAASPLWAFTNACARGYWRGRAWRAPCPVVSIGNIVAGGVGKTEVAAAVVARLQHMGRKPVLLMRGYGASALSAAGAMARSYADAEKQGFPDEALIHLLRNPTVPVVLGARRSVVLQRFWKDLGADAVVLDDGLQHFAMARDLDVVVHDFSIADPVLRDFPGFFEGADLRVSFSDVPQKWRHLPWVRARYVLDSSLPAKALAFCAIGNPDRFSSALKAAGVDVISFKTLPDHAPYDEGQRKDLAAWYQRHASGGVPVLTTRKDAVKLTSTMGLGFTPRAVDVKLEFSEGAAVLEQALMVALAGRAS